MPNEDNTASDDGTHKKPPIQVRIWHALWRKHIFLHPQAGRPHVNWAEKVMACVTVALLIVGAMQAYIYWKQSELMKLSLIQTQQSIALNMGQVAIAGRNAKTAEDSLVLSNRPWIKIKHRIISPLNFEFHGAAGAAAIMAVEDTLENVGNSVALDVISWEDVIPVDPDLSTTSARKRREEWCNANKHFDPTNRIVLNGTIMFPHDPVIQVSHVGPLMSTVNKAVKANIIPLKRFFGGPGPNTLLGKVEFVMVGCVDYRSSFEPAGTRPHTTQFLYRLAEPFPNGAVQGFIDPHGTADKLQLIAFPEGFVAD